MSAIFKIQEHKVASLHAKFIRISPLNLLSLKETLARYSTSEGCFGVSSASLCIVLRPLEHLPDNPWCALGEWRQENLIFCYRC